MKRHILSLCVFACTACAFDSDDLLVSRCFSTRKSARKFISLRKHDSIADSILPITAPTFAWTSMRFESPHGKTAASHSKLANSRLL